jgi:hypothetical protein
MTGFESALPDASVWCVHFLIKHVAHGTGLRLVSSYQGFKRSAEIEVAVLAQKK